MVRMILCLMIAGSMSCSSSSTVRSGSSEILPAAFIGDDANFSGDRADGKRTAAERSEERGDPRVLIGYFSLSGNTEKMATAVAEGVRRIDGVTVLSKPVGEVTLEELSAADGLILGSPTHFANIPGEMKTTIDNWVWKSRANFTDKVGGAFATGGNMTGGKEHVVVSLLLYMLNNRMMIVGPIYKPGPSGYGEIGASATTGADDRGVSEVELEEARKLGERVAAVVRRLAKQ